MKKEPNGRAQVERRVIRIFKNGDRKMNDEQGYTDGGQNPHYEGLFDGETEDDKEKRIRWAMNEDQLPWPGMMAAFERYYSQSWFDKNYRYETAIWAAAWKAAKTHNAELRRADDEL